MELFDHDSSPSASSTCTAIPASDYHAAPVARSWSLHTVLIVTAAFLAGITTFVSLGLGAMHLRYYMKPQEQRQLIRIVNVPAIYSIFCFFAVWFYDQAEYLTPCADLYECFSIVALFYYIIVIVTPDESNREAFFQELELQDRSGQTTSGSGLQWFSRQWFLVFQLLPGRIITTIATWIVVATCCPESKQLSKALLIINVINGIQMVIAIMAILRVYGQLKFRVKDHHIISKFAVLKGIIFILLVQRAVFSGLNDHGDLHASTHISAMDLKVGIPNFIILCEMFLSVWGFVWAYHWSQYAKITNHGSRGFFLGLVDVWNVLDILGGVVYGFRLRSRLRKQPIQGVPPSYRQPVYQSYEMVPRSYGEEDEYGKPVSERQHV